jgi:FkbM family methyltransferase
MNKNQKWRATITECLVMLRVFSNWPVIIYSFLVHRPIARVVNRRGLTIINDHEKRSDIIGLYLENFRDKLYDPQKNHLNPGDAIIDIGANIGVVSCYYASAYPAARIFSYEPARETFRVLTNNIKTNTLSNVLCHNQAVGGARKTVVFYEAPNPGHSTLHPYLGKKGQYSNSYDVEQVTLMDVFNNNGIGRCAILKLDCEGAEYDILFNMAPELFQRIERVYLEYHDNAVSGQYTYLDIVRLLETNGMELICSEGPNPRNNCGMLYFRKRR